MSSASFWLRYWHRLQVRQRATLYQLYNQLPRDQAYAAAARDVADQQREERQSRRRLKAERGNTLLSSVLGLLERMHDDKAFRRGNNPPPNELSPPRSAVPPAAVRKRQAQPELAEGYPIGIFGSASPSGAQLIPDSEFHTSIHALDRSTQGWRKSIQDNARIEQERREHWARRLAEMKASGKLQ
jgi:hypothetical protein